MLYFTLNIGILEAPPPLWYREKQQIFKYFNQRITHYLLKMHKYELQ